MSSTSDNSFAAAENAAHLVSIDSDDSFSQIVTQSTQPEAQTPPRKLRRPGGCQGRGSCRVLGSLNCQDLYQDLTTSTRRSTESHFSTATTRSTTKTTRAIWAITAELLCGKRLPSAAVWSPPLPPGHGGGRRWRQERGHHLEVPHHDQGRRAARPHREGPLHGCRRTGP